MTDRSDPDAAADPMSRAEFIALMAMLAATVAFSIDAMLPSLPHIAADLRSADAGRVQLVITSFVLGTGVGTFFTGPLSDTFGRKPVMVGGALIYIGACLAAWQAQSLEALLAARVVQGLGAAGPRVVAQAVIRDRFSGRMMARVTSFVMTVFTLVPAIAPTIGAGIAALAGWRAIFLAFVLFSAISIVWLLVRLPETLAPENRRPLRLRPLLQALREVLGTPTTRLCIVILSLAFGMLFGALSYAQPVFDLVFGLNDSFPFWFGGIAVVAGTSGLLNARLVVRTGMRPLLKANFAAQVVMSGGMALAWMAGLSEGALLAVYVLWTTSIFFQAGMTIGNLNALALEPLGHVAGMAASVVSALSTVIAVLLAAPLSLIFDGTPLPLAVGVCAMAAAALALTTLIRRESD